MGRQGHLPGCVWAVLGQHLGLREHPANSVVAVRRADPRITKLEKQGSKTSMSNGALRSLRGGDGVRGEWEGACQSPDDRWGRFAWLAWVLLWAPSPRYMLKPQPPGPENMLCLETGLLKT